MTELQIVVDYDKSSGLGMCEAEAPSLFDLEDDGTLVVLDENPGSEQRRAAEAACRACPTEAISLVDE